jgi:hypothetical protein
MVQPSIPQVLALKCNLGECEISLDLFEVLRQSVQVSEILNK